VALDATMEIDSSFARRDLIIETGRTDDGSIVASYGAISRDSDRHVMGGTLQLRPHFSAVSPTDYGPLWLHLRASTSSFAEDLHRVFVNEPFLDDAWASVGAFTVGRRFSYFDYNPGFGFKPGYTSYRTTNLVALSSPVSQGLSVTLAVEDGSARQREDGVWSSYKGWRPDLVAAIHLNQGWGNAHASFAAHEITHDSSVCVCTPEAETFGFAGLAGFEYRHSFGETHGRILITGAVAEGALDYLGVPRFAPDYIADADGQLRKTKGYSALASYEHVWRPNLRTVVSLSTYGTSTSADGLRWQAQGYLGQMTIEYMPAPGWIVGAEASRLFDKVIASDPTSEGRAETHLDRYLLYLRRFF
jgi:hypothetical protein